MVKTKQSAKKDFDDLLVKICTGLSNASRKSMQSPTSDVGARRAVSN